MEGSTNGTRSLCLSWKRRRPHRLIIQPPSVQGGGVWCGRDWQNVRCSIISLSRRTGAGITNDERASREFTVDWFYRRRALSHRRFPRKTGCLATALLRRKQSKVQSGFILSRKQWIDAQGVCLCEVAIRHAQPADNKNRSTSGKKLGVGGFQTFRTTNIVNIQRVFTPKPGRKCEVGQTRSTLDQASLPQAVRWTSSCTAQVGSWWASWSGPVGWTDTGNRRFHPDCDQIFARSSSAASETWTANAEGRRRS